MEENMSEKENDSNNSIFSESEIGPELEQFKDTVAKVKAEIHKIIIGQDAILDLILIGLFSGGHVLLEGVPGIAKTLIAKLLARTLSVDFSRIQFTPDLMPTDITGTNIFNLKTSEFEFKQGPIFSNIVLIDEINRSPAKTQAALFEVMEEKQLTIDGKTHQFQFPFFVIATQNPIEQEGTYKLPEAQLDRFIFKIKLTYPSLEEEEEILTRFNSEVSLSDLSIVKKAMGQNDLKNALKLFSKIYIKKELLTYITQIIYNSRNNSDLFLGASPRASLSIMNASKVLAAMKGRDFVIPEDIQYVAYPVLNHRIILSSDKEMEGVETEDVIKEIIRKIEVPR